MEIKAELHVPLKQINGEVPVRSAAQTQASLSSSRRRRSSGGAVGSSCQSLLLMRQLGCGGELLQEAAGGQEQPLWSSHVGPSSTVQVTGSLSGSYPSFPDT